MRAVGAAGRGVGAAHHAARLLEGNAVVAEGRLLSLRRRPPTPTRTHPRPNNARPVQEHSNSDGHIHAGAESSPPPLQPPPPHTHTLSQLSCRNLNLRLPASHPLSSAATRLRRQDDDVLKPREVELGQRHVLEHIEEEAFEFRELRHDSLFPMTSGCAA